IPRACPIGGDRAGPSPSGGAVRAAVTGQRHGHVGGAVDAAGRRRRRGTDLMGAVPEDPPFDLAETDRLLSTTRGVRRRLDLDRPVGLDVVLDCLRLAIQAPTGSNRQDWRWMVVTDPAKRAEIARRYAENGTGYLTRAAREATDEQ